MLFGPEDREPFRDPRVDGRKAAEPGVAGTADGDQEIGIAAAGMPMMNVEAVPCPAARAAEVIAGEDDLPIPAEVIERVPTGAVTLRAKSVDRNFSPAGTLPQIESAVAYTECVVPITRRPAPGRHLLFG
jgi:hypothetical protein